MVYVYIHCLFFWILWSGLTFDWHFLASNSPFGASPHSLLSWERHTHSQKTARFSSYFISIAQFTFYWLDREKHGLILPISLSPWKKVTWYLSKLKRVLWAVLCSLNLQNNTSIFYTVFTSFQIITAAIKFHLIHKPSTENTYIFYWRIDKMIIFMMALDDGST